MNEDVASRIEEFADEHDISRSDATRRFVLAGMVEYGECPESARPASQQVWEVRGHLDAIWEIGRKASVVAIFAAFYIFGAAVYMSVNSVGAGLLAQSIPSATIILGVGFSVSITAAIFTWEPVAKRIEAHLAPEPVAG